MPNSCSTCNKSTENTRSITESNKTDLQIIINLRKCVPEVNWKPDMKLCQLCLSDLEKVRAFREMCIQSHLARKSVIKIEEPNEFICHHCAAKFKLKPTLIKHLKQHKLTCLKCNKKFTKQTLLVKHKCCQLATMAPNSNMCDLCATCFSNKYLLRRHVKNVHATEKKYKCELCERKFASSVYLNAHKRYHYGERKHICSFCGKGYITGSDLYHHEKIHANKRAYRCEICPKAFNTSSDLHKHKICVHLDRTQWKYECTYCQRRFPLKTNMNTHTKTHTGERNYQCHLCDRKCINNSVLRRHIESHSIVKLHKCTFCLQSYKYEKSLNLHLAKVHSFGDLSLLITSEKQKRFACNLCEKRYFSNSKLEKHLRTHTGERPFKCLVCDKCFTDKDYVRQHMKLHNNLEK